MDRKSNGKAQKKTFPTNAIPPALSRGDIICPKCKGHCFVDAEGDVDWKTEWEVQCNKCWGAGKLDWIERIMGKPDPNPCRTLKGNWTMEMNEDITTLYDINLDSEILDALSKELAEKIDEEIIGNIIEFSVTKTKLR